MRSAQWGLAEWEEHIRHGLLTLFFVSLSLPIAIQQTALGLLLAFFAYTAVVKPLGNRSRSSGRPQSAISNRPSLATPLHAPFLLVLGAFLLSTFFSPDVLNSLAGYRKLWLVGAFFVTYYLVKDLQEAWWLTSVWLLIATVIAAYGIVQHYAGIDWARELVGKESNLDPFWFGREEGFRTKGLHPSGITYAHNLLIPLIFVSVLLFSSAGSWRQWFLHLGSWGLMVFALLFSLTRGVWLAYLIVLLLLGILKGRKAFLGVVGGMMVLSVLLFSAGAGVQDRAWSLVDFGQNLGRSRIWQANIDMIRERPLLGWGYGNYRKFRDSYYERYPGVDTTAHAHNTFLQIWVDTGLLGLVAFLSLFGVALRKGWHVYRRCSEERWKGLALGGILGIVGFLLGGLTQYNFGDAEAVIVLWVTVGILMRLVSETPLARA